MSTATQTSRRSTELLGEGKLTDAHRERLALVYVRQSTVRQVEEHRGSTEAQYSLARVARRLGWRPERIEIIDEDLGLSGASARGRTGFQRLLSEVALNHVGLVLGVEMSRLARSCTDWYHLLELCALFGTLIADLDGLYDPSRFNDRLLLGLKGTMSEAELHIIKQRMQQGLLQKARQGELWMRLPVGYVHSPAGEVTFDPDEEVVTTVKLVFETFERLGTVNGVLRTLVAEGVKLGVRLPSGPQKGSLEWRRPNRQTLLNMLHNPTYAGAYVYGRRSCNPRRAEPGRSGTGRFFVPRGQWEVCLRDRLPAYITWEQFERNLARLKDNRSHASARGAIRAGSALLAGVLFCGRCGRRMSPSHNGRGQRPRYACGRARIQYGEPLCQDFDASVLDEEVSRLVLEALEPASLEVSLRACEEVERERGRFEERWRQRLERAHYESERAARQYQAVEPENRLVARSLERAWEEKLREEQELVEEYERSRVGRPREVTAQEREQIRALAADLPALWNAPTTTIQDRKTVVRLIIEKVVATVESEGEQATEWLRAEIHWAGGATSESRLRRSVGRFEQLHGYSALIERLRAWKAEGIPLREMAERLNAEGWRSPRGLEFTDYRVGAIMKKLALTSARRRRILPRLGPNEWWVPELARDLRRTRSTIYQWIAEGRLEARQPAGAFGLWIVTIDAAQREELRKPERPD